MIPLLRFVQIGDAVNPPKYTRLMKIGIILLLFTTAFISSCRKDVDTRLFPDTTSFSWNDVEQFSLTNGRHIEISPPLKIWEMAIHDTLLILTGQSAANEYRLHVHHSRDGSHLNSFAMNGRGPGEFLYVSSIQLLNLRRELYFLDRNLNLGAVFSLDSLLSQSVTPLEIVRFKERAYTMHLRLDSTNYLCGPTDHSFIGLEPSYLLYYIYNTSIDGFTNRVSLPPLDGVDSLLNISHLSSIFKTNPNWVSYCESNGYVVSPYIKTDLLEIYDYRQGMRRMARIQGPDSFLPLFEFTDPPSSLAEIAKPDKTTWRKARSKTDFIVFPKGVSRNGYFRARAYERGFYVMYSGIPYPKEQGASSNIIRYLFYFSYDGVPLRCYKFDVEHGQVYAVDDTRGVIYILTLNEEIYAFDIPD